MLLNFFVARLKVDGRARSTEVCLRFKATEEGEDFTSNEPVLASFCFPLGPEAVTPKEYMASEEYTFTLTYGDGRRFHGFCRKFLPPPPRVGSKLRYPQVLCLICEYPWCNMYFKVLQVLEQLLKSGDGLLESGGKELPSTSAAGTFLKALDSQLKANPTPGQIIRVAFPKVASMLSVSPPKLLTIGSFASDNLSWGEDTLELQVPPDCGNGKENCGVPLARLLWHVPVHAMVTLIASMLLERRIIIVGQSQDTVTAAVQAASAILYPFKWHHIYLPLLPKSFKDYLTAPMPFMVGLPAQMLPLLKGLPTDEVVIIDLDLGKCDPAPGTPRDDANHLPHRQALEAALQVAYSNLRSPTEYESSPLIAGIMQEYFLKLFGNYRAFIHEEGSMPSPAAPLMAPAPSPRHSSRDDLARTSRNHPSSEASGREASNHRGADDTLKGSGYFFDHSGFVWSHRKSEKTRRFLDMFRHSQMYEVFLQERMKLAKTNYETEDTFELKVNRYLERKKARAAARARAIAQGIQPSKWSAMLKKHRRTDSEEGTQWGKGSSMRRITTDPTQLSECGVGQLFLTASGEYIDPAAFFEDDDDYDDTPGPESPSDGAYRRVSTLQGMSQEAPYSADNMSMPSSTSELRQQLAAHSAAPATSAFRQDPSRSGQHQQSSLGRTSPAAPATPAPAAAASAVAAAAHDPRPSSATASTSNRPLPFREGGLKDMLKQGWSEVKSAVHNAASSAAAAYKEGRDGRETYRKQNTGDGKAKQGLTHKYLPQTTGGSLLDAAEGRLKQPPAPSRPLNLKPQALAAMPSMNTIVAKVSSVFGSSGGAGPEGSAARKVDATAAISSTTNTTDWDPFGELAAEAAARSAAAGHMASVASASSRTAMDPFAASSSVEAPDPFDGFSALASAKSVVGAVSQPTPSVSVQGTATAPVAPMANLTLLDL